MKIALSGYYGFDNSGDEALLSAITSTIRKIEPQANFVVFSGCPGQTARLHGLRAVNRMNPCSVTRELIQSDLLISGGGSLFQDVTGPRSLPYYISIVALAKILRKPVIFYAQGIGPITRSFSKLLMRLIANKVELITLRDAASRDLLYSIGVNRPPVEITADPVFNLEAAPGDYLIAGRLLGIDNSIDKPELIGVSVRAWRPLEGYQIELAQLLDMLAEEGFDIVFMPLDYPNDLKESQKIAGMMKHKALVLENHLTSQQFVAVISNLQLVIGMRLHSLIFSAIQEVPFAGISYDPKIDSFLEQFNYQPLAGSALDMKRQISRLLGDKEGLENSRNRARQLKAQAEKTAHLALSLIKHPYNE